MRNRLLTTITIILSCGALLFQSCGGSGNENDNQNQGNTDTSVVLVQEQAGFVLPSPLQISYIFKKAGLKFMPGITNPVENVSKYNTDISKSLSFGVYSADLSYCVFSGETQHKLDYIKVVKQLADELGMLNVMDQSLVDSFEKNVGKEDSLVDYLATSQERMDQYLKENAIEYKEVIFFLGAWIEGMYLGSRDVNSNKSDVISRLVEQMTILDNILIGLKQYPSKESEIAALVTDVEALKKIFSNFDALKSIEDVDDIDFEQIVISIEELGTLSGKIEEVRTKIIAGK
ncbi:MAG: hypothetical protein KKA07_00500 [Bacteroidetes bacterium]|nr:hypothetical protein [Bacteroidota bacterium]MBU1717531.1 hypothetical protein [Bacteroidota bacterium]